MKSFEERDPVYTMPASRIYQIARKRQVLMLAGACLLFAFVLPLGLAWDAFSGAGFGFDSLAISVAWIAAWTLFSYIFLRWALTARLIITPTGIDCNDLASLRGFTTGWENIRAIQVSRSHLYLFLSEPCIPTTKLGRWAIEHSILPADLIDLASFIDHWKDGELRRDFERYAAHLFESNVAPK